MVGNLLVIGYMMGGSSTPLNSSVTDSRGNTYAVVSTPSQSNTKLGFIVGRMDRPLKTGDTITIIATSSVITRWAATVLDYSNAHLTGTTVDATAFTSATSTAPSVTTGATTVADEIVLGFTSWAGGTGIYSSAGAGFTQRGTIQTDGTLSFALEDKTVSATGTQTVNATLGSSVGWVQVALAIRGSTRWYVDYSKADDTGAGTSWATAKKNLSAITPKSGDIITMAKSSAPSALTGTMTFTDNSTSVSTSADLSATLAAKDMIGPYTGSDELAGDGWWEVSSVTSSTITLANAYTGTTRSSVTGYRSNGFDAGSPATSTTSIVAFNTVAGSQASPIRAVGGYDTGTDTRTGITHFRVSGASKNGQAVLSSSWQQMEYVGMSRSNKGWIWNTTACGTKNCFASNTNGAGWDMTAQDRVWADTCYVYKTGGIGFNTFAGSFVGFINCVVQGTVSSIGIALAQGCAYSIVDGCTVRRGTHGISVTGTGSRGNVIRNCTINNNSSDGINLAGTECFVSGGTYSSNGTDFTVVSGSQGYRNYVANALTSSATSYSVATGGNGWLYVDRHNQTAGDYRLYQRDITIQSNTAQARGGSGHCVQISPTQTSTNQPGEYAVPIPTDASGTRTVTCYLKKDAAWDGDILNIGLRVNGVWQGGTPTARSFPLWPAGLDTSYVQYTFAYTMTEIGVLEFVIQANGNGGSLYLDDLTWT